MMERSGCQIWDWKGEHGKIQQKRVSDWNSGMTWTVIQETGIEIIKWKYGDHDSEGSGISAWKGIKIDGRPRQELGQIYFDGRYEYSCADGKTGWD